MGHWYSFISTSIRRSNEENVLLSAAEDRIKVKKKADMDRQEWWAAEKWKKVLRKKHGNLYYRKALSRYKGFLVWWWLMWGRDRISDKQNFTWTILTTSLSKQWEKLKSSTQTKGGNSSAFSEDISTAGITFSYWIHFQFSNTPTEKFPI